MENFDNTEKNTFLGFRLGNETFAINIINVLEVIRKQGVTSVPKTAEYIVGVINFRGEIVSVVSARKKLNVPDDIQNFKKVIIVIELFESKNKISKVGIIADKVLGVLNIPENDIQAVMEFGNYYNPEFLIGAFKYKDEIITILDIEKIFSEQEIEIIRKESTKNESTKINQ